jgi:hypothetical protein
LGTGNQPETSAISEPPTDWNEMTPIYVITDNYGSAMMNGLNQIVVFLTLAKAEEALSQLALTHGERGYGVQEVAVR